MVRPNKNLGQHWLQDVTVLNKIASYADLSDSDVVLEIGPGPGTLTTVLASQAGRTVAVEFDQKLAAQLAAAKIGGVEVINEDFLQFDLSKLPKNYKVVANIPYYITNKIIMKLLTSENKPSIAVLLVQKEVAERLAAKPGKMSILSIAAQLSAEVNLGQIVKSQFFTPPPKVDSQVVILKVRREPLFENLNEKQFFHMVKAGFSSRRKKLRTALAGGLNVSVKEAEKLLHGNNIDPNLRAQDLTLGDWLALAKTYQIG